MAGCYGSDPEDRYHENRLIQHLETQDINKCDQCGDIVKHDLVEVGDQWICEACEYDWRDKE